MDGQALFAVVVTSALPTAQNVFVAASRYRTGLTVAKDTVLITTVVAVPAMIGVALLLDLTRPDRSGGAIEHILGRSCGSVGHSGGLRRRPGPAGCR